MSSGWSRQSKKSANALSRANIAPGIFIDTSIAIAVLRRDQAAVTRFRQVDPIVSTIVVGELLYGATRAHDSEQ